MRGGGGGAPENNSNVLKNVEPILLIGPIRTGLRITIKPPAYPAVHPVVSLMGMVVASSLPRREEAES